jgi:HEAT repeat protein
MITSVALLPFFLQIGQAGTTPPLTFQGKPVPFVLPASRDTDPDSDVRAWTGWGKLAGSAPHLYPAAGDWSKLTDSGGTIVWREKFVLFSQIDRVRTRPDGTVSLQRFSLDDNQLLEATLAIRRLQAEVSRATEGKVQLISEIAVEHESLEGRNDEDLYAPYLAPRINGGLFEAEDKVYRGPYHGIIAISPEILPAQFAPLNGIPLDGVSFFAEGGLSAPGTLDIALFDRWTHQVETRSASAGIRSAWPIGDEWRDVTNFAEIPVETLEANLRKAPRATPNPPDPFGDLFTRAYRSANYATAIESDIERGHALVVRENPGYRGGGAALALDLSKVDLAQEPILTFSAKTDAKDPLAIRFRGASDSYWVSLGRDLAVTDSQREAEANFKNDGAWHLVRIDLAAISKKLGGIQSLSVEPPLGALVNSRLRPPTIELRLDGFATTTGSADYLGPRTPNLNSTDPLERAAAVPKATAPELINALADPDRSVKATALLAYQKQKAPLAEPALIEASMSIDPQLAALAIPALVNQDTEISRAAVRNALKNGLTDRVRAAAALALAESKDPKLAGDIMILLANRSWQTREASVRALAQLPGLESGIIRLSYLQQVEPRIKLAATISADPTREYDMRKVQWSAVNEPSDLVRLISLEKLIQAAEPAFRADGYKGVRDDSTWVRQELLAWMGANPAEAHRPAISLGLADSHASVRAAALRALARQATPLTLADLTTATTDRYPVVQIAVLEVANQNKITLPESAINLYKASLDPMVGQALAKYQQP